MHIETALSAAEFRLSDSTNPVRVTHLNASLIRAPGEVRRRSAMPAMHGMITTCVVTPGGWHAAEKKLAKPGLIPHFFDNSVEPPNPVGGYPGWFDHFK